MPATDDRASFDADKATEGRPEWMKIAAAKLDADDGAKITPTPVPEDGPLPDKTDFAPGELVPTGSPHREEDRYAELADILDEAFEYASKGKGEERHGGGGTRWADQRHAAITKEVGLGFPLGQAVKKAYESQGLGPIHARRELLGAITYLASAVYGIDKGWRK